LFTKLQDLEPFYSTSSLKSMEITEKV